MALGLIDLLFKGALHLNNLSSNKTSVTPITMSRTSHEKVYSIAVCWLLIQLPEPVCSKRITR
jgi:hypothetical protein